MTRAEFLKQLNEGRLLPAYLLLGEERLFHEELLEAVALKMLPSAEREFNFTRINAGTVAPEELTAHLETGSLFGNTRLIWLDEFENASAAIEAVLLEKFAQLPQGVHLFVSALKLDARKKSSQELRKHLPPVDCSQLAKADLPVWVKQRAQKMGLELTPEQARLICERSDHDSLRIKTELEKLHTFAGNNRKLADKDLEALLPGEPEPDIFGLIDAVAARNPCLGLPRLEELLNSGENELKILATLSRQFRNIAAALEAQKRGMTPRILADFLGIKPFVAEKSFNQARFFTLPELQKILSRLLEADYRIKTGRREPRLELELAVVEITAL
ncbi:MAG: DNA polymerase III subunit delta [Firmicutes bacterium]|nr:DNA polymerase III subunit delta [Bacillota bacterium]